MRKLLLLAFLLPVLSCADDAPEVVVTNPTPIVSSYQIEYRVTGTASPAQIKYGNSIDGVIQIQSSLPFFASVRSSRDNIFISLDVMPIGFGFVSAQIFINGYLWREGSSSSGAVLSVSGTLRKSDLP